MKVQVDRRDGLTAAADVTASGVFERPEKDDTFPRALQKEDEATHGLVKAAWARKEIKGKRKELTVFHRPDGKGRIALIGLGPHPKYTADVVRRASAEVVRGFKGKGARTVAFRLSSFVADTVRSEAAVAALTVGAILGNYEFQKYKSTSEGGVEDTSIHLGEEFSRDEAALKKIVSDQGALADVVVWTREIANLPADTASPSASRRRRSRSARSSGSRSRSSTRRSSPRWDAAGSSRSAAARPATPRGWSSSSIRAAPVVDAPSPWSARGSRSTRAGSRSSPR